MYVLLFYDYVENIVERVAPYREAHRALLREYVARGELVLGGAFADPADGAALVFKVEDRAKVEEGSLCCQGPRDWMADPRMDSRRRYGSVIVCVTGDGPGG